LGSDRGESAVTGDGPLKRTLRAFAIIPDCQLPLQGEGARLYFGRRFGVEALAIFDGKFDKTALVVSSGRTGTKALAQHLSGCYSSVCALHEPPPSWRLRRASARALAGRAGRGELVELLARSRRKLAFGEVFPNAHIIHVVRDPRTYIRSGINFGAFSGAKQLAVSLIPWWLPKPENFDPPGAKSWSVMSGVERLAWYWAMLNTELNRGEQVYGSRYLRITFEDLFAREGHGLRRLTEFLGLPGSDQLLADANRENVNASTKNRLAKWEDWDEPTRKMVLGYCGELMELYGYTPEPAIA
jgi:hypothetical protein